MKCVSSLFLSVLAVALFSCSESAIHKKMSSCDSLVIEFYSPHSDSIIKTFEATGQNAIRKMAGFVDGSTSAEFKCGYDGHLVFYSGGKAQLPIMFQYREPDCRHFLYESDGKTKSTKLNQEAADFL